MRYIDIPSLLGKTIAKVIVSDSDNIAPHHQIFLQFTDGTYIELYSSSPISVTNGIGPNAMEYARKFNKDQLRVFERPADEQ